MRRNVVTSRTARAAAATAIAGLVSLAWVAGAPSAHSAPATPAAVASPTGQAAQMLALVNADRAANGVGPLSYRDDVAAIAQGWTDQMVAAGTLSHNDAYFSPATHDALGAQALGENVGFSGSMEAVEIGFMNSPHHRENVLDPRFTAIGVGVRQASNGSWWVTQDFIQENAAPAPVADAPTVEAPAPDPAPPADAPAVNAEPVPAPSDALPSPAPTDATLSIPTPADGVTTAADGEPLLLSLPSAGAASQSTDSTVPVAVIFAGAALVLLDAFGLVFNRRRRAAASR